MDYTRSHPGYSLGKEDSLKEQQQYLVPEAGKGYFVQI